MKILIHLAAFVAAVHGLIHLMGFAAYWPLITLPDLPYRTSLLSGRWEVGSLFNVAILLPLGLFYIKGGIASWL